MANAKGQGGRPAAWVQLVKRNAVVAAIVLFVCVAVYLNWDYQRQGEVDSDSGAGKTLGSATLVGGESGDPLLDGVTLGNVDDPAPGNPGDPGEPAIGEDGTGDAGAAGDSGDSPALTSASAYFANARLNRQQARDSALALLQQAGSGEEADQAMRDQANAAIQAMADYTVTEAQIENLVVAKGYADCVAFISDDNISVVVQSPETELTAADTAKITDIVTGATGFTASQIKIIPVN